MPTNLYGMRFAILAYRADLGVFVNVLLNEECLYLLNVFHSGTY